MKNWIIGGLVVALVAVSIGAGVLAQSQRTANVEVRVWEDVNDPERNYISARPEGGSWRTLGTIPLPLTDGVSSSGRFRYGDITLAVPLSDIPDAPTATPTPTPAPSQATTATASGTGPAVARITLGEGQYICEILVSDNLTDGVPAYDGAVRSRIVNSETGVGKQLSFDSTDSGTGEWGRVIISQGLDYLVEVTRTEKKAIWTVRCTQEEIWYTAWRASGGKIGYGTGPKPSLISIERKGVHTCTTSVSNNVTTRGTEKYFLAGMPTLAFAPSLTPYEITSSGTWERVITFPESGLYYVEATSASQDAQWSVICE